MMRFGSLLAVALVVALAGCEGGGGNPGECSGSTEVCEGVSGNPDNPGAGGPVGLFKGTTGTGRVFYGVVRNSGDLWFLYSQAGNGAVVQGAETGIYTYADGAIGSNNMTDFTSEVATVTPGVFSGNLAPQVSLAGTVTLTNRTFTFSAIYDATSGTSPALGGAAGTYAGVGVFAGDQVTATLSVTAEGALTGNTVAGCNFSGNLIPEAALRTYSLTLTFVGGPCPTNLTAANGVAFLDGGRFYLATMNPGRNQGFAFSGGP
jgi:hypothetical protein